MTKPLRKALLKSLEKHRDKIGKERDGLREIKDEMSSLLDATDRGLESLESAIDYFSQLS